MCHAAHAACAGIRNSCFVMHLARVDAPAIAAAGAQPHRALRRTFVSVPVDFVVLVQGRWATHTNAIADTPGVIARIAAAHS